MRDPYEVLGVAKGAEIKEVKRAYRKLARQLHPDLHPGDKKSEERFKEVASAYDFLSDEDRKRKYDAGEIDATGAPRFERRYYRDFADSGAGGRYADPGEVFRNVEDLDIFSELFRGVRRDARKMRGADLTETVEVDFLDAVNGGERTLTLPTGKQVKVRVPVNAQDGTVLRLKGQGLPGPGGGPAGDLRLQIRVRPHPQFTRVGSDIHADLPITLAEAVLGGRVSVSTVDGPVTLTVPAGANTGMRLRVRGKGAPLPDGGRGDHYVTIKVMLPETIDADLARFIDGWAAKHPYRVRAE